MKALAEQAGRDLEDASALEILTWAAETFGKRFCVTSSMEDAGVVAHLASLGDALVEMVRRSFGTGYHFPETIGTRDAVDAVMDVNVITLTPLADGRRAGRRVRPEAPRHPATLTVPQAPQGPAAGGGPEGLPGLGDRPAPRRNPEPGRTPRSSAGTRSGGR
ncbi:Phosphoadenosine phosphosulfate reductase [Streptomyces griseoloalbus]